MFRNEPLYPWRATVSSRLLPSARISSWILTTNAGICAAAPALPAPTNAPITRVSWTCALDKFLEKPGLKCPPRTSSPSSLVTVPQNVIRTTFYSASRTSPVRAQILHCPVYACPNRALHHQHPRLALLFLISIIKFPFEDYYLPEHGPGDTLQLITDACASKHVSHLGPPARINTEKCFRVSLCDRLSCYEQDM